MATILEFRRKDSCASTVASRSTRRLKEAGEVIIFPGVRIEREGFKLSDRPGDRPSGSHAARGARRPRSD